MDFCLAMFYLTKMKEYPEGELVENAQREIRTAVADGRLKKPATNPNYFAGNYQQQILANQRMALVVLIALLVIILILYFHGLVFEFCFFWYQPAGCLSDPEHPKFLLR